MKRSITPIMLVIRDKVHTFEEPLVSLKWNNWQAIFFNRGHSFAIQELPDRENVFSLTLGGRWLTGS